MEAFIKVCGVGLIIVALIVFVNFIDPEEHRQENVDGHLYEVFDQYKNDSYVHSPDCWCQKDSIKCD